MARKVQTPPTFAQRFNRTIQSETFKTWSHRTPTLMVAGVALYVSYWHIRGGAVDHGYDLVGAAILPLSVDGLLIASARYVSKAKTILGKGFAFTGFILGIAATLAGNLLTVDSHDIVSYGFAVWPALAVIITGAMLHWGDMKPKPKTPSKAPRTRTQRTTPSIPTPRTPTNSINSTDLSAPATV